MDDLFGISKPEAKKEDLILNQGTHVQVQSEIAEDEYDAEKPVDPEEDTVEKDQFSFMLDSLLESEGVDVSLEKRKKYNPAKGNFNNHDWASARESIYSDEAYQFRCRRCLKWVNVRRDQTLVEACEESSVDLNCGSQVLSDIMSS